MKVGCKIFFAKPLVNAREKITFALLLTQSGIKLKNMDTLSYRTKSARKEDAAPEWYIVDVAGLTVGRIASKIAHVLRGKHQPNYTPHVDCGDCVIVINAENIRFTGNKWDQKTYLRYSGYPGGQKSRTAKQIRDRRPEEIVERAVRGMLPKNKLGRAMFKKLYVYTGSEHPHAAQQPKEFNF